MKKFLALYMAPAVAMEQMMKDSSTEDMQNAIKLWEEWIEKNSTSLIDGGDPLGKTKQASKDGITDIKNDIGGYSIVQADSHEEAMKLFGPEHPHLSIAGATIEVMEIIPMPVA